MEHINDLIQQAYHYHKILNFQDAEKCYLKILKLQSDNDLMYYNLAMLYRQSNNLSESLTTLKTALKLNPNNPVYYINLGELMLKLLEPEKTEEIIQDIILSPNSSDLHYNLAESFKKSKNYKEAIENYKNAIDLDPKNERAYNALGNLYLEYRDYISAKNIFDKLYKINPNFPYISEKLYLILNEKIKQKKYLDNLNQYTDFEDINKKYDTNNLIHNYITLLKYNLTDTLRLNKNSYEYKLIKEGLTWPLSAETMTGIKRLNNLHYCVSETLKNDIPGDLIETGVWRGGSVILMKALLQAYNNNNKKVWVADSFEGLPPPDENTSEDKDSKFHEYPILSVSLDQVKVNFQRYNLLDDNVIFLNGWFEDTLPSANIDQLSILRLDGDMYKSTLDALETLYPKLSIGGYIIVDDYNALTSCKNAVDNYRDKYDINEEIKIIDYTGVFWKKEK